MELRPYQQAAVDSVYEHLRSKDNNPCVVCPPGCGKSVILAQIAKDAVTQWHGRVLILAHVKELLEQNADKLRKLAPELKIGIYSAGLNRRDTNKDVIVAGIQSVYDKACDLGAFDLIIIDEVHLCPPPSSKPEEGEGMYRTFLNDMKVINPNVRLIGLTATPYRLKGGLICKPDNLLNEICYEAGLKEMIQQGYLSPLISKAGRTQADLNNLHIRGGEFVADEVEAAMDKDELVSSACREIVELTRDRKSVLIFGSSVAHCGHIAEKITAYSGQECAVVTGNTPSGERAEIIARFRGEQVPDDFFSFKPPLKYLANVNVLCLSEDTEILTSKGFVGIDDMSFEHLIAAWKTDGNIEFAHPRNITIRERAQNEPMVSVQKGKVPLYRVTVGHRMVVAYGKSRKKVKIVKAEELIGKRHCVPPAGMAAPLPIKPEPPVIHNVAARIRSNSYNYRKKGIPAPLARQMADELIARQRQMKYKNPDELTAAECELIGFWVGDGSKSNKRYTMCQSMCYPAIVNWVDEHIKTIGLHASKCIRPRTGKMSADAVIWDFAKGTGGDKQYVEGGIFPYFPYLKKGWNDLLFAFSRKQYEAFLYGLWLADGLHTDDLTATHYSVASDAYELYNCLQAIGAMRGFSTILHKTEPPRQPHHNQQWIFRWAKKEHLCYLKHSAVLESEFKTERVWCVESLTGFLICRRHGKTFVTGNCTGFDAPNTDCVVLLRPTNSPGLLVQQVGRGTRLYERKKNCLVLDYSGNILRHGPIDMIAVKEPGTGKGGDAPAKKCPQCLALIHAGYRLCPECSYAFPENEDNGKLSRTASSAGVISGETSYSDYEVLDVLYCVHEKRYADPDTPRTLRVDYRIAFGEFKSEWVCPEHTGYARGKFEKWWRERAALGCTMPMTAQEAVSLANAGLLSAPESISVKTVAGEKFERITGWRLKERPVMREPGDDFDAALDRQHQPTEEFDDDEVPF